MKRFIIGSILILTSCAAPDSMSRYSHKDVGISSLVEFGTIMSARRVDITGENSGAGATAGGALGAAAANNLGGGNGQVAAVVGGAIVGALAGHAAEQAAANRKGVEYTIVQESGKVITLTQNLAAEDPILDNGSRVIIQTSGSYQRVLSADHLPETVKRPKGVTVVDE